MIRLEKVSLRAGSFALDGISFEVRRGEYAVLMGRTGSGKSTILEAVCGLKPVAAGRVLLGDADVTRTKPAERGIGYVPQDGALFSTLSVRRHLAFALEIRGWARGAIDERVLELGDLLGITSLFHRKPAGLSGGERQRVALGRALSFRPDVLLLDEPLSALDEETKGQMYALLKRVQEHEHVTILHVTHSLEEAGRLADRIFRIVDGAVVPDAAGARGNGGLGGRGTAGGRGLGGLGALGGRDGGGGDGGGQPA
jgi:ABC-type sugar transport system ATPase subunit